MLVTRLKELKESQHLTVQQIADRSGVPASTISRILSRQTDNPSFQTISDIVRAMGGSIDDLLDSKPPGEHTDSDSAMDAQEREHLMYCFLQEQLKIKDDWIKRLFLVCLGLIATLITLIFIDVLNGGIGFVRY